MFIFAAIGSGPVVHVLRIAAVPALVGVTAKSFEWVESALSPNGKQTISQWLQSGLQNGKSPNWPKALEHLIDRIFGKNPFSWKFFFRSCIASALFGFVLLVIFTLIEYRATIFFMDHRRIEISTMSYAVCFVASFVGDYLSLLVSRKILQWMSSNFTFIRVLLLLLLDTILSVMVATVIIFSQAFWVDSLQDSMQEGHVVIADLSEPVEGVTTFYQGYPCLRSEAGSNHHIPFCADDGTALGIYFYSSFGTSLWVWLYVLGGGAVRILSRTKKIWAVMSPFLDLDGKPLTAIGRVAAIMVGACYLVLLTVVFFVSRV